jgi:riboflavin kinase/FMN adenylyltransferase
MEIISSLNEIKKYPYPVVTMGNFDGVHAGHQKVISAVISRAQRNNGTSIVITYKPNTKVFFEKINESDLIYTEKQKFQALENLNVDVCIVLDFTSIKDMTAEDFVKEILVDKIGMKELVIGYDTNFGSDQKGDKAHLDILGLKYGFTVTMVEPLEIDGKIVSSTGMRKKYILEE